MRGFASRAVGSNPWNRTNTRARRKKKLTGMDNVHGTHSTTGVVENPFFFLVHELARNLLVQLGDDVVDNRASVISVSCNGTLREIVQLTGFENVELLKTCVEIGIES